MKSNLIFAIVILMSLNISAQTLISTSDHYAATANTNQRKIIRDSQEKIFVVFSDLEQDIEVIKGVYFDVENNESILAEVIVEGQSPTLAIGFDEQVHMVYESNDSDHRIMYMHSDDYTLWSDPIELSYSQNNCRYPIADIDAMGVLNVFWIEEGNLDNLNYCNVLNDSISDIIELTGKEQIYEISIANHLQYELNDLYFGISFSIDSVQFFRSVDYLNTIDTIYSTTGLGAYITFNSYSEWSPPEHMLPRFIYTDYHIIEAELAYPFFEDAIVHQLPFGPVNALCVDDIAPPIGYSFIFLENGLLKHGFSYGAMWNWTTTMSSYQSSNEIHHPNVAYKHFNPLYVDFIWMEESGNSYGIYHKREDKHVWMPGIDDLEEGKGFTITGSPNPFSEQITIEVIVEEEELIPSIEIYNTSSQQIVTLSPIHRDNNKFYYVWKGTTQRAIKAKEGIYIVLCSVGDKRTARKIVYKP